MILILPYELWNCWWWVSIPVPWWWISSIASGSPPLSEQLLRAKTKPIDTHLAFLLKFRIFFIFCFLFYPFFIFKSFNLPFPVSRLYYSILYVSLYALVHLVYGKNRTDLSTNFISLYTQSRNNWMERQNILEKTETKGNSRLLSNRCVYVRKIYRDDRIVA